MFHSTNGFFCKYSKFYYLLFQNVSSKIFRHHQLTRMLLISGFRASPAVMVFAGELVHHWGAPLVVRLLVLQEDVPGPGEHIAPFVPVHRVATSLPHPNTLFYPAFFLVRFTVYDFGVSPVHDMIFLTTVFVYCRLEDLVF